jgi:hypothetical protein
MTIRMVTLSVNGPIDGVPAGHYSVHGARTPHILRRPPPAICPDRGFLVEFSRQEIGPPGDQSNTEAIPCTNQSVLPVMH